MCKCGLRIVKHDSVPGERKRHSCARTRPAVKFRQGGISVSSKIFMPRVLGEFRYAAQLRNDTKLRAAWRADARRSALRPFDAPSPREKFVPRHFVQGALWQRLA